jgi:hypothetical protein
VLDLDTVRQIAENALQDLDANFLLVFADALEELGDTRAVAVRQHAFCCPRGFNIASKFLETGTLCRSASSILLELFCDSKKPALTMGPVENWPCVYQAIDPRVSKLFQ